MPTQTAPAIDPLEAARGLRLALDELSDGLASGRIEALLDVEPRLARAVAGITSAAAAVAGAGVTAGTTAELRAELAAARAAIGRCALLGRSLDDLVRARCGTGYRSSGSGVHAPVGPSIQEQA